MREQDLLQHVYGANQGLPDRVLIPPGDDMGAIRIGAPGGQALVLVTVDQVAEGVHFDLGTTGLEKVGRKAVMRSLSDIAAMAAVPCGAVLAACLPRGFGTARARALFDAAAAAAKAFDCPLVGGDICMWDQGLVLTVTAFAEPGGIEPVRRQGARAGDAIYVTGTLGGSLQTIDGSSHHLDFEPRIALARALARQYELHCMIDLSDGLGQDLGHLCRASGLGAVIYERDLPISAAARVASAGKDTTPWYHALCDGEDYELCFTVNASQQVRDRVQGVPITKIGHMTDGTGGSTLFLELADGTRRDAGDLGWEHRG